MQTAPDFSFIIPFFNCEQYLQRAIDSVLVQPGGGWELILVDDGSRDASRQLARTLETAGKARIFRQRNSGPGAARNLGAKEARGEYLWFLDCDDELLPHALERARAFLAAHPGVDMLVGGHLSRDERGREAQHLPGETGTSREENFRNFIRKRLGGFSHGAIIFRKTVFKRLHYPEEIRNNEDLVLQGQVLANHHCARLPEPPARIHGRSDSLRHQAGTGTDNAARITALLFDPQVIPANLMPLAREFEAGRKLSRFRALYRSARYQEARRLYRDAVRQYPPALLRWSYLSKYLRLLARGRETNGRG